MNNNNTSRIYLARPDIRGQERVYAINALESGWVTTLGPYVEKLEKMLADYVEVESTCATSSGTSAIHLALKLAGVKQDDIVFCQSLTFCASANPIMYEKAKPVFIDSEPGSYNMSPRALRKALELYSPKAVIIVDLYGQSADMDQLLELCTERNITVIEDAAEALGSTYKGKRCGSFGAYGIVSFNGNKIITCSGGGMLLSNNKERVNKARFWATQSRESVLHYEHKEVGYNYRLSNVSAAIGCAQFEKLEERIASKKHIYDRYEAGFAGIPHLKMLPVMDDRTSNYWLSCVKVSPESKVQPNEIIEALEKNNIEARPIWKPMHLQPLFEDFPFVSHYSTERDSVSQEIFDTGLCLPSDTNMSDADQDRIISIIQKVMSA